MSVQLCLRHPRLRAVALEPQEPPRRLAQLNVASAGLSDRVEIRAGLVEDLEDREAFDLVWLPGNFLGSEAMPKALAAVHRALRPGGHLLNACLGGGGDDQRSTAARLRAVLWGGDTVAPEHIADLLRQAGFDEVALMDRLPSGLVPMQARRRPHMGAGQRSSGGYGDTATKHTSRLTDPRGNHHTRPGSLLRGCVDIHLSAHEHSRARQGSALNFEGRSESACSCTPAPSSGAMDGRS